MYALYKENHRPVNNGGKQNDDLGLCITGISCRLPESDDMDEFWANLVAGIDMVTEDNRRWEPGLYGLPRRNGKLKDLTKFDASFFEVSPKQADRMDPGIRMLLETTYEAITDSGVNPESIRGSKTGVFIGQMMADSFQLFSQDRDSINGYEASGASRTMTANRLSYFYDLKGPSLCFDTACSSGLEALCNACWAIQDGRCDAAIVGAANIILSPEMSMYLHRQKLLSQDGTCKSFDISGDGYCRSEGVVAMYIQNTNEARRCYMNIRGILDNCDGYTEQGITFPNGKAQNQLMRELYSKTGVDPRSVSYVEAHGTGTIAGDPQEVNSLSDMFCSENREPLLLGSVKSNIGHTEAAAGLAGIAKVVLASEKSIIPPNIHYKNPNPKIPAIHDGRIKVVDKPLEWKGGIIGLNSFGFGGANVHVILESHESATKQVDTSTRLLLCSGRTPDWVERQLNVVLQNQDDLGLHGLLDEQINSPLKYYPHRGFTVLNSKSATETFIQKCTSARSVWFIFPGMGCQWPKMGRQMFTFEPFARTMQRCHDSLMKSVGFDLLELIQNGDDSCYDDPLNAFVGISAIQVSLVETLKVYGVSPEGMVGHSVGELGCAFADGTLTAGQTVLAAYWRGRCVKEAGLPEGAMAAVGLTWKEAFQTLPDDVVPACHNAEGTVTISGPKTRVQEVVEHLIEKGKFARLVNSSGIAFHSYMLKPCGATFKEALSKVIPDPKKRSTKWISSSVAEKDWDSDLASMSSSSYHTNNFLSPVLFHEALQHVPRDAICLEIGPHGLLQSLFKRSLGPDILPVSLMKRMHQDNVTFFLSSIGKLYVNGVDIDPSALHDTVHFPVPRGTSMLSPCVQWDHSTKWEVVSPNIGGHGRGFVKKEEITLDHYILDHCINGRVLYPASGYLVMAWQALAERLGKEYTDVPVHISDFKIHRASVISEPGTYEYSLSLSNLGHFELSEKQQNIAEGHITLLTEDGENRFAEKSDYNFQSGESLMKDDVYQELRLRGYDYGPAFQGVQMFNNREITGVVEFRDNWISHLDAMMHIFLLGQETRSLRVPVSIKSVFINPVNMKPSSDLSCHLDMNTNTLSSACVCLKGIRDNMLPYKQPHRNPLLQNYTFVPYLNDIEMTKKNEGPQASDISQNMDCLTDLKSCLDTALENLSKSAVKVVFLGQSSLDVLQVTQAFNNITKAIVAVQFSIAVAILGDFATEEFKGININRLDLSDGKLAKVAKDADVCIMLADMNQHSNTIASSFPDSTYIMNIAMSNHGESKVSFEKRLCIAAKENENIAISLWKSSWKKTNYTVIDVDDVTDFTWVEDIKQCLDNTSNSSDHRLWLVSNKQTSGIVGMVNCLMYEKVGNVRCICNLDSEPIPPEWLESGSKFNILLEKDLVMNVYSKGVWGSFRHGPHSSVVPMKNTGKAIATIAAPGDLSSLQWTAMDEFEQKNDTIVVKVAYAPLNFRDVMIATGRLSALAIPGSHNDLGIEFSGQDDSGVNRMGIDNRKTIATHVQIQPELTWEVPRGWSLEEAATVPMAYVTAYYSLKVRAQIKEGQSVLIHSATSAVGQACIKVAKQYGCQIFATVGNVQKKQVLIDDFQLEPEKISDSHSLLFVNDIMRHTNGRGVDVILNSLAGEKLLESVHILARDGHFLEIGKYDLSMDTKLGMSIFLKNISFHGVLVENIMDKDQRDWPTVHTLVQDGIDKGVVTPLRVYPFEMNQLEEAFRFMAEGKHIGKVVLKIENGVAMEGKCSIQSQTFFNPQKVYLVTGGLGGLGLEMCIWMAERSAMNIAITSRSGVKTSYQKHAIQKLQNMGVNVQVFNHDVSDADATRALFLELEKIGPIGGVFHLAAVLQDSIFAKQTPYTFKHVGKIKINGIDNLDKITREKHSQTLDWFIAFTSATAGFGNAGQSNYGFANSYMERVTERRVQDNVPGRSQAFQWGFMGDVGIVQKSLGGNQHFHMGTVPQRIHSFKKTLDAFMQMEGVIYSSIVPADQSQTSNDGAEKDTPREEQIVSSVMHIIGIKDTSNINPDLRLAELGLDSLMTTEIHQVLGRKFNVQLSLGEVMKLTFKELQGL